VPTAGEKLRVLVVDDSVDAAETMVMLLSLWGHDVQSAADGPTAIATAAAQRPDVVLLDIGLPGMSGYDVAERIRAIPELPETILVAMTGYGQAEDKARSRQAGFTLHLVKPVEPPVLQKLLSSLGSRGGGVR
jgi:two-component system, chemotaxis family, CheB/CheR fusion protein